LTISSGEIRKNMTLLLDGDVYQVLEWRHRSAPKAPPTLTLKVKHLRTGNVLEKKFNAGQKLTAAPTLRKKVQFLFRDADTYTFMDTDTFEQFPISAEKLGDDALYLAEGDTIEVLTYRDEPIAIDLPPNVTLTIAQTDPGFRGDTASGATKPAVTNTGLKLNVPLFLNAGERVRVDTRTGEYTGRAD
jgi:elongation factor P